MQQSCLKSLLALLLVMPMVAGCAQTHTTHGQIIPQENLAMLEEGQHDKLDVLRYLGSPSSETPFEENKWLYITTKTEHRAFNHDEVIAREILMVEFDDNDKLARISRLSKQDGRHITPLPKETRTQGQSLGILDQMFDNLGRGFGPQE